MSIISSETREMITQTLFALGGMFDPSESALKRGCLFFSSFSRIVENSDDNEKYFFNKATNFNKLYGRLKDTIDNTISDHILDLSVRNGEKHYKFKRNVESIIRTEYDKKCPLGSFLIWLYRYNDFECLDFTSLQQLFYSEFNLSQHEVDILFTPDQKTIVLQETYLNGSILREKINIIDTVELEPEGIISTNINLTEYKFENLIKYLGVKMPINQARLEKLLDDYKQIILTGVPGTGKSYLCQKLVESFEESIKIQFHPEYTYQDFIFGKTFVDNSIKMELGQLTQFIDDVKPSENPDKKYLVILDEINRGNISSIFGEFLYTLDRGNKIKLPNGSSFELYNNVYILGTMNSADRSIALVDYAIRRRFYFVNLEPNYELVDKFPEDPDTPILGDFLRTINKRIVKYLQNPDYQFGHSYFILNSEWDEDKIYDILHFKILPMLEEYCIESKNKIYSIISAELLNAAPSEILTSIKEFINSDDES
jgi:5-methylcytosine-specific restriction enzyme B